MHVFLCSRSSNLKLGYMQVVSPIHIGDNKGGLAARSKQYGRCNALVYSYRLLVRLEGNVDLEVAERSRPWCVTPCDIYVAHNVATMASILATSHGRGLVECPVYNIYISNGRAVWPGMIRLFLDDP